MHAVRDDCSGCRDPDLGEVADGRHAGHALDRGPFLGALVGVRVHEQLAHLREHREGVHGEEAREPCGRGPVVPAQEEEQGDEEPAEIIAGNALACIGDGESDFDTAIVQ